MSATGLWLRSTLRRGARPTVALALLAGLGAAVVGLGAQGARRSHDAVGRYLRDGRTYDVTISACPPGVDPNTLTTVTDFEARCGRRRALEFAELLTRDPRVEAVSVTSFRLVGLLDPTPNRRVRSPIRGIRQVQRRMIVLPDLGPDAAVGLGRPIMLAGRLPREGATDEVVVTESAAASQAWRIGDTLRLGSWRSTELDDAIAKGIASTTRLGEVHIVGIGRTDVDLTPVTPELLGSPLVPGALLMGSATMNRFADSMAGYGYGTNVRLAEGPSAIEDFTASLQPGYRGWSVVGTDISRNYLRVDALRSLLDTERGAVWAVTAILAFAVASVMTFTSARQIRVELSEYNTLATLGMTRRGAAECGAARGFSIGVVAAAMCAVAMLAGSPRTPYATARRLEYRLGVRVDATLFAVVLLAMIGLLVAVGTLVGLRIAHQPRVARPLVKNRRRSRTFGGAVVRSAASLVRHRAARTASCVAAVAVAACVASAVAVGSADRVAAEPVRYGNWWDISVGNYSDPDQWNAAVRALKANPNVIAAAAYLEPTNGTTEAKLNGAPARVRAQVAIVGRPMPPMVRGRLPRTEGEIALGIARANALGVTVGNTVRFEPSISPGGAGDVGSAGSTPSGARRLRVVGIAVALVQNGGDSSDDVAYVTPSLVLPTISTSLQVRFDPAVDRDTAIASLAPDFSSWMVGPTAADDVRNVLSLRPVPWLLAGLLALLAFASLVFVFGSIFSAHRADITVLYALGMRRRTSHRIAIAIAAWTAGIALVIGLPAGTIGGRIGWRALAHRLHLVSGPVGALAALAVIALGTVVALIVAAQIGGRPGTEQATMRTA